jgi:hypothetical protein
MIEGAMGLEEADAREEGSIGVELVERGLERGSDLPCELGPAGPDGAIVAEQLGRARLVLLTDQQGLVAELTELVRERIARIAQPRATERGAGSTPSSTSSSRWAWAAR